MLEPLERVMKLPVSLGDYVLSETYIAEDESGEQFTQSYLIVHRGTAPVLGSGEEVPYINIYPVAAYERRLGRN